MRYSRGAEDRLRYSRGTENCLRYSRGAENWLRYSRGAEDGLRYSRSAEGWGRGKTGLRLGLRRKVLSLGDLRVDYPVALVIGDVVHGELLSVGRRPAVPSPYSATGRSCLLAVQAG